LAIIAAQPPQNRRAGLAVPIEGDRWIVTLVGYNGDHPPADEAGFVEFARMLAAPDLAELLPKLEPIGDIFLHKLPSSLRRRYEQMARFPEGYLVMGDAICSFNPAYGQGMTSAALQAEALDHLLATRPDRRGLAPAFFRRAAKIIDTPWQMAVGEDFRFPGTEGQKASGADLLNAYMTRVHRATHTDSVVYAEFIKVLNLMQPPMSLFKPSVLWRVWQANRRPHVTVASPTAEPIYSLR
jgi:2-polyprenyl-6-methoxyphenol hydroxylase-like FAD-dependent oxidoreductase